MGSFNPPKTAAPVDLDVLARLMGNPAPESLSLMLATFWQAEGETPLTLRRLAAARDGKALAGAAHAAKGTASYVGAHGVVDLCRALEMSARREDWAAVADLTARVEKAYAEIGAFIHGSARAP